ncbi:DUF3592 domain-containing protein [Silvimonas sp.]|uniref:DUF3592 domain-containing protein n=1 Tax=Silvimonas sp. TaxID=2650811 RepID=UPI002847FD12|nr:DUF3592 domain-containing protein [Silvimonas sp.]MDR3427955.1 DUF3592 domain-containing protein [Silvimonas sp.]
MVRQYTQAQRFFRVMLAWSCIVVLLSGAMTGIGLYGYWRAHVAKNWPTVTGVITRNEVVRVNCPKSNFHNGIAIEYNYNVRGHQYTGNDLRLDRFQCYPSQEDAAKDAAAFVAGKPAVIHYSRDDPADSVLIPENSERPHRAVILGGAMFVVMMVFGIALFFWFERRDRYTVR